MKKITPETSIKKEVKDYLQLKGWFVIPILQGLGSYRGISDIIAVKESIVLFIEVKTEKGKQSKWQIEFEKDIVEHGGNYLVVRGYEDIENWSFRKKIV